MQLISKGQEREWFLVDEWITKSGLKARLCQCVWNANVKSKHIHDFYTGYVQVPDNITPLPEGDYDVHGGVTFYMQDMKHIDDKDSSKWIGFDMMHIGDENLQDENYARAECEKLADQIIKSNETTKI